MFSTFSVFNGFFLCRLGFVTGSLVKRLYIVRSTELRLGLLCTMKLCDSNRASQIFRKCRSHLQMIGAWRMTWSNFHAENPQFLSDLWTSLLSEAFCSMHVNWYTFFYAREKVEQLCWKLGAALQNYSPGWADVRFLTFIGPCIVMYSYNKSQRDAVFLNFILAKNSTCFGRTYYPSSGVLILYSQQLVFGILITLTVCWWWTVSLSETCRVIYQNKVER
jgi:hypothetical protein